MAECKDLQALSRITSEVDDSQVKIILSSQCIKAQIFLVDRLRKESERQKELCKYISSGNLKLEAEIKHAEQELRSLMTANETIKISNVDVRKEYLLAKERKLETAERVKIGETKYELLWQQCKKRYESIPFVQKWFEKTNMTDTLKERIKFLLQETEALTQEIKTKTEILVDLDKMRIIEIAHFMVHERPKKIAEIQKKMHTLETLSVEIDEFNKEQAARRDTFKPREASRAGIAGSNIMLVDGDWPSLCDSFTDKDSLGLPKLQMAKNDLDILNLNLEQIKRDVATPIKTKSQESPVVQDKENEHQKEKHYTSSFFNKSYLPQETDNTITPEEEIKTYARKKLINILEDISVDKKEAVSMMATVDPNAMQEVAEIKGNMEESHNETDITEMEKSKDLEMECEDIEEIDMSAGTSNNIVIPPTQFMDYSHERGNTKFQQDMDPHAAMEAATTSLTPLKCSQEGALKKKVVFDLPPIEEVAEESACGEPSAANADEANGSQLNASAVSDDSFSKIKEMILRKHNLDLSPDFVYAKKTAVGNEDNIIASKFFKNAQSRDDGIKESEMETNEAQMEAVEENIQEMKLTNNDSNNVLKNPAKQNVLEEPKNENQVEKTVSGFLFTHGPHGIPDSLDVSISTTGFEDGDGEFPHCIDSSLLLSPKADLPKSVSQSNTEVFSQEVPNFLSGMRKTGLSFFGKSSGASQPDSSAAKDGNNFSFNFSKGDDKRSRGGLFSMFH